MRRTLLYVPIAAAVALVGCTGSSEWPGAPASLGAGGSQTGSGGQSGFASGAGGTGGTLPVLIDPAGNTLDHFEQGVAPLNVVVDRDGRVLWSETGTIPSDLEGLLRGLMEEQT